jgi:hypothetical protein
MVKPIPLILPSLISVASVFWDWSFCFLFRKSLANNEEPIEVIGSSITVETYVLADAMSYLKTIWLNMTIRDLEELQVKILNFGLEVTLFSLTH